MVESNFIPKNEMGVFYLFSRYHEKLGIEKILKFNLNKFPDVIALKAGKTVKIEIEYKLRGFLRHYILANVQGYYSGWRWKKKGNSWFAWHPKHGYDPECIPDPKNELFSDGMELKFKSLKGYVDIIICWIKDCSLPEDFEIIEFRKCKTINTCD